MTSFQDFMYRLFAEENGEPDDEKIRKYLSFFFGLLFACLGLYGSQTTKNYCLALIGYLWGQSAVSGLMSEWKKTKQTQQKQTASPNNKITKKTTTKEDK